jgi:hypothetical protein
MPIAPAPLIAVFIQVNALPRAERETSILNGDRYRHTEQRALDVTRHIVVTLVGMTKRTIPRPRRRHETIQSRLHVDAHVGIGVFIDRQRRRSVLEKQMAKPDVNLGEVGLYLLDYIVRN